MSRTETKGERKRTTMAKQNTNNGSYLVEEVGLAFTDALFKVDAYF